MYQSVISDASTISPVELCAKIRCTAASIACSVVAWKCECSPGTSVSVQTRRCPTAPSRAKPRSVSGTSAFSTAKAIAPAWSSSLCRANRSTHSSTSFRSRVLTSCTYRRARRAKTAPIHWAAVFDTLSERLQGALGDLRKRGRLDEESISRAMREVRLALLEADVNFEVVKDFVARVRERALGAEVLKSLTPGQQVVKIVHEELTALMGSGDSRLAFAGRPPTVILLAGLQGSGKTTAAAKLALLLRKEGKRPALVAADLQRPAAIDQLEQLGRQIQVPVHSAERSDPVKATR